MVTFGIFTWPQDRELLPQLFAILAGNMSRIAPTGNTYEEDYAFWTKANVEDFERDPGKTVILIRQEEQLVGYFQYRVRDAVFRMEDIQFDDSIKGKHGVFRALYGHLLQIPEIAAAQSVWANVSKRNMKSIAVLTRLGLHLTLEKERSFHYTGEMSAMKAWLQEKPTQNQSAG